MKGPLLSGFCNPSNDAKSHGRCAGCGCTCHQPPSEPLNATPAVSVVRPDAVTEVTAAVERLQTEQDALIEACTDPEATDMAELLYTIQQARTTLQAIERDVEMACAKAMLGDQAITPTLRVERYRSTDRKQWQHDEWQRDVRRKAVQSAGLKGAQVLAATGELLPPDVLFDLLSAVQAVHSAAGPKTGAIRGLGLDPADYCESNRGAWHVKVQRIADETEQQGAA